jgi:hypothetical protein
MRLSEFCKIYSGFFVLGPAIEKIYSQVRLMLSHTVRYQIVIATCSYFGIMSYGQKGVETVSWESDCMGSRGLLDSFSDEAGLGTDQSWMKRDSENERMVQKSPVM